MKITHLFVKRRHGAGVEAVKSFQYDEGGIAGNVACAPFRQVLIVSQSLAAESGLRPGDLRENVVVDCDRLYELPSGTVVQIGKAQIRLTFHCEVCKKVLKLVEFERIFHKRGVFGKFLNAGSIALGDEFVIGEQRFEPIPYEISERIRWFLKQQAVSSAAVDLIHAIGLPASCAKFVPRFLQKLSHAGGSELETADGG